MVNHSTNNVRKVSLEETEPIMAMMRGEEDDAPFTLASPRKQDSSSSSSRKSAMIKRRDSSLLGSEGRVSFDSNTSFDQATNRAKFDIFLSSVHSKENFARKKSPANKSSSSRVAAESLLPPPPPPHPNPPSSRPRGQAPAKVAWEEEEGGTRSPLV
mmetsp:Transcript_2967/g.5443  ORF Transcript_2967/g.5443 Transcript_2967/m.5443 type:complete len:157 (+) Transcript_2967:633-1103(+)